MIKTDDICKKCGQSKYEGLGILWKVYNKDMKEIKTHYACSCGYLFPDPDSMEQYKMALKFWK